jgi:hypothetical protein
MGIESISSVLEKPDDEVSDDGVKGKTDTEKYKLYGDGATEEELKILGDMTREEWREHSASNDKKTANIARERKKDKAEWEQEWKQKTEAMKRLQPTGDPVKDFEAFFNALGKDPSTVGSIHKKYFENKDQGGILQYFKLGLKAYEKMQKPDKTFIAEYYNAESEILRKFIESAEANGIVAKDDFGLNAEDKKEDG